MYRVALSIARSFTLPVIVSYRSLNGKCATGIGAFIVINKEGWILTAAHIVQQFETLMAQAAMYSEHQIKYAKIQQTDLSGKEKRKAIVKLGKLPADHVTNCSAWWGQDAAKIEGAYVIEAADIALAKLEGFNPERVRQFPIFKDPTKEFEPGVSLCKLGFPFHSITPEWDETRNAFRLPKNALPVPFFPVEGLFTRTANIVVEGEQPNPKLPLRWLETSSPGLRGQSGGPIIDVQGTVWAMQVNTAHYPLGFNPPVPGRPREKVPQFLNVGRGVQSDTILAFLREHDIEHEVSTY